jgi:uncharacterized membrane protein
MPRSTAKIGRHPLHPLLVLFPIGFWVSALLCDLVYWQTLAAGFAEAALWLVGAGLIGAVLAALAGLADFLGDRAIRRIGDAWQHMLGNVLAVVLALISFGIRLAQGAEAAVLPWGLTLSLAIGAILLFTGWKGGELVFRHGVAVERDRIEAEPDYAGLPPGSRKPEQDRHVVH